MRNSQLLLSTLIACAVFSCKKDNLSGAKAQYAKLIVGTWKAYQQNTKVYDLTSNELLKDSTVNFTDANAGRAFTEIYNTDGSAYITAQTRKLGTTVATTDTTSYLRYTILGANLTLKQSIGGTETKPILTLTLTDMGLQSLRTGTLNEGWGLDVSASYRIVQGTYYTRQ
ncbi:MAG: hypothetical protein H7289_10205 [Mucilaginibacter sp.]|nr:hypothetical protein [Mucilaginibacter sp.]